MLATDHFSRMKHGNTRVSKASPINWLRDFIQKHAPACPGKYVFMDQGGELYNNPEVRKLFTRFGFSPRHSTTVGRILNPQTGHISPQYHIVVDEHFSTVMSSRFDHELFDGPTWNKLVQTGLEKVLDPEDMDGETVPFAEWFDEWVGSSDVASSDSSTSASEGEDVDEAPASAP